MWSVINFINETMATIKQNPILAGIMAMWGATVVGFFLRSFPKQLWGMIYRNSTISITMDSDVGRYFLNGRTTANFAHAMVWISNNSIGRFTRELRIHSTTSKDGDEIPVVGIGDGTHYVWWKRRLFIIEKGVKGEDKGTERLQYLRITMIGRNQDLLKDFVLVVVSRPTYGAAGPRVYQLEGSNWVMQHGVPVRKLDSVFLDPKVKSAIMYDIEDFLKSRDWYRERNLAYKQSYMFYGEPGTGKTSLIRAIGGEYQLDMYIVDLATAGMRTLAGAINEMRNNNSKRPVIMVFEDIDSTSLVTKRSGVKNAKELINSKDDGGDEDHDPNEAPDDGDGDLSLKDIMREESIGTLLNILDGIVPIDNVIFMASTNHIEKIDPAILRPGRTDFKIEIPFLHDKEIKSYLDFMYGVSYNYKDTFMPIAGCQLELLFKTNKHSIINCINQLPTWEHPKCLSKSTIVH